MKPRILIIEDEQSINNLLRINLEVAGYEVVSCMDGLEAAELLARDSAFDCAVVDVMLPGRDGFSLLPEFEERSVPVIFLTAKSDLQSRVTGLRGGAEDYIVKPFEMLELLVRLEKVLERHKKTEVKPVRILDVEIDPERHLVTKGGVEVSLKPMEYECLLMFVKHRNKALTREELLAALWGVEFEGETRTVDAHVGRIRKKLGFGDVIRTIPKVGYRLEVDE